MSNKCVIKSVEEFSNYASKVVNGITSLCLPEPDLLIEPDDIEEARRYQKRCQPIVRDFKEDSICSIQFFNLAVDIKPFFTQFHIMYGDPEVCAQELLPLPFDTDQTCAFCKSHYEGKVEWLQCKICEKWFHERCFFE